MTHFTGTGRKVVELVGGSASVDTSGVAVTIAVTGQPVPVVSTSASIDFVFITWFSALTVGTIPNRERWARCYHHRLT
jgi:hypothetical protein